VCDLGVTILVAWTLYTSRTGFKQCVISFRLPLTPLTDPRGIGDIQDGCSPREANSVDCQYWRFAGVRVFLHNTLDNALMKSLPLLSSFALLGAVTVR
jgi:hypothetical protein